MITLRRILIVTVVILNACYFAFDRPDRSSPAKTTAKPASINDIAPEKFADFKRVVLRPKVHEICMSQLSDQFGGNQEAVAHVTTFCKCYVEEVTEAVTKSDMFYLERHSEPSADMEVRMQEVRQSARQHCS